ncbi:MAG: thioredoxin family protein, partial [Dehalococcoidia bacterium]
TPAFCQTRFCGPVVDEVVRPLEERHGEVATFIHIEPFDLAKARGGELVVLPVMAEWALATEPWVFVVDRDGKLAAKFEGITSAAEVEEALLAVLE